jgi:hypothetical protein
MFRLAPLNPKALPTTPREGLGGGEQHGSEVDHQNGADLPTLISGLEFLSNPDITYEEHGQKIIFGSGHDDDETDGVEPEEPGVLPPNAPTDPDSSVAKVNYF